MATIERNLLLFWQLWMIIKVATYLYNILNFIMFDNKGLLKSLSIYFMQCVAINVSTRIMYSTV